LLGCLEQYDHVEVEGILGRMSAAIGRVHAEDFDVRRHLLDVACTVLRRRGRRALERAYGERLEQAGALLWLFDEDEYVLAVSERAAASLGYAPVDLVGHSNEMFKAPGQDWSALRHDLDTNGGSSGVTLALTKDGRVATVEHRARTLAVAGAAMFLVQTRVLTVSALADLALMAAVA
jgi:PAS domain S-box-containing protein